MLSAKDLVKIRENPTPELPSFGMKDFWPDGSCELACQVQNSLSEIKELVSYERVKTLGSLSQAVWQPELHLAEITHQTGSQWATMGHTINQKLYLYPEEALYLLETGALEIWYDGVSMSVERAYFVLIEGENDVTIEKYRVYSYLNNNGYKVLRHSPINTVTQYEKQLEIHKLGLKLKSYGLHSSTEKRSLESSERNSNTNKKPKMKHEEMSFPVVYKESDDTKEILKKMQIFQPCLVNTEGSLYFDYDIYNETNSQNAFKKSCLQLPNYRVIAHRSEDSMPDMKEIVRLSRKYKDGVPVIHAIVFLDYIAFYEINPVVLPDVFDQS